MRDRICIRRDECKSKRMAGKARHVYLYMLSFLALWLSQTLWEIQVQLQTRLHLKTSGSSFHLFLSKPVCRFAGESRHCRSLLVAKGCWACLAGEFETGVVKATMVVGTVIISVTEINTSSTIVIITVAATAQLFIEREGAKDLANNF